MREERSQDTLPETAAELAPALPRVPARSRWLWLLPLLVLAAAGFIYLARGVWAAFALAIVLAYLVSPLVELAHRR